MQWGKFPKGIFFLIFSKIYTFLFYEKGQIACFLKLNGKTVRVLAFKQQKNVILHKKITISKALAKIESQ